MSLVHYSDVKDSHYTKMYYILLLLLGVTFGAEYKINDRFEIQYDETSEISLLVNKNGQKEIVAKLGHGLNKQYVSIDRSLNKIEFRYSNEIELEVSSGEAKYGLPSSVSVRWRASPNQPIVDCFDHRSLHWYGGPQQKRQYWPIEKLVLPHYSYVSKEADNAAIAEPYWLSSDGLAIYVDKTVPLFIDQNSLLRNSTCFEAVVEPPYSNKRQRNELIYTVLYTDNARTTHEYMVKLFLKKPSGYPDHRMVELPIWSTWAEYKRDINESTVMEFANKIIENGFQNSQMEIDDLWEVCYGSLTVDTRSFPDLRRLNRKLKEMGFRVTVWAHPFINKGCEPWYSEALNKGYLVKSENGSVDTSWWNDNGTVAAYIDFTNEEAAHWWSSRLKYLQETYEIDSYKFDAGESSWSPQVPVQIGDVYTQPSHITRKYVEECAKFGHMVEVRAGQRTQELPVFVRMIDKDSEWDFENGLPTLITTLLQMNMNGYPLVLPDMIGGNGYNLAPPKEMFIRWLQANTFMPSLQYSYVPWDYDQETVNISRIYTELHATYSHKIIRALQKAVENGNPVNPPIWWIDPEDTTALGIWDEYLLGEDILAAPVIVKGAISRDIYLPAGEWLDGMNNNKIYKGRQWIRNYSAPLNVLPYFIKRN